MTSVEVRRDPDGTLTVTVQSEDFTPEADLAPWLAAFLESLNRTVAPQPAAPLPYIPPSLGETTSEPEASTEDLVAEMTAKLEKAARR